jgi:hypothetical protein
LIVADAARQRVIAFVAADDVVILLARRFHRGRSGSRMSRSGSRSRRRGSRRCCIDLEEIIITNSY